MCNVPNLQSSLYQLLLFSQMHVLISRFAVLRAGLVCCRFLDLRLLSPASGLLFVVGCRPPTIVGLVVVVVVAKAKAELSARGEVSASSHDIWAWISRSRANKVAWLNSEEFKVATS